jgi:hypothetical protein
MQGAPETVPTGRWQLTLYTVVYSSLRAQHDNAVVDRVAMASRNVRPGAPSTAALTIAGHYEKLRETNPATIALQKFPKGQPQRAISDHNIAISVR